MAFLIEIKGPDQGKRFDLQKDATTLGRRQENEIPVESNSVSGRHLVILREGARYKLKDLDSTNGTMLNGTPVREAMLEPNSVITMGDLQFEFNDPSWAEITPESDEDGKHTPTVNVKPASAKVPESFQSASPFGRRRDFSNAWMALIILAAVLAGGAAVYFMFIFFRG